MYRKIVYFTNLTISYSIMDDMSESSKNVSGLPSLGSITTYSSGVLQAKAHRLLNRKMAEFLRPYDITCMQWFIIGLVYDAGPKGLRLSDLMRQLDTTLPFITNSLNLLESKRIVQKQAHPTDNRTKIVTIRSSYRPTVAKTEADLRAHLRELLYDNDEISPQELQAYISVLIKIAQ